VNVCDFDDEAAAAKFLQPLAEQYAEGKVQETDLKARKVELLKSIKQSATDPATRKRPAATSKRSAASKMLKKPAAATIEQETSGEEKTDGEGEEEEEKNSAEFDESDSSGMPSVPEDPVFDRVGHGCRSF